MKCLITGGSGFLGSHIADELTRRGYKVTIFDNIRSKWVSKNQKMVVGDLLKSKSLKNLVRRNKIIFHFAALADLDKALHNPIDTVKYNVLATVKLLNLCVKYNVKRFIFASTIYANSNEGGFYKSSKRAAEDYIEEFSKLYKLKYTILRYGSLFGLRSDFNNGVRRIIEYALKEKKVCYYGSKETSRNYIHVADAARLSVDVLKNNFINKNVVIMGKKKIKITELLKIIKKYLQINKLITFKEKKLIGHYINSPSLYKFKKEIKIYPKENYSFNERLTDLINSLNSIKK
jgi:UDP-glucose 4-epimerase